MNSKIVIEKNVPIPVREALGKYPFHLLELGDSFLVSTKPFKNKSRTYVQSSLTNKFRSFCLARGLDWKCITRYEDENNVRIWRVDEEYLNKINKQRTGNIVVDKNIKPKPSNKYNFGQMQINDSFLTMPREGQSIKSLRANLQSCLKTYNARNKTNIEIVCRYEGKGIRTWRIK